MGSLSRLFARGGGPRPRTNGARSGPLRKIVSTEVRGAIPWETLECGHEIAAKRDLMGFTNAVRRRCWKCKKEIDAAIQPDPSWLLATTPDPIPAPKKRRR